MPGIQRLQTSDFHLTPGVHIFQTFQDPNQTASAPGPAAADGLYRYALTLEGAEQRDSRAGGYVQIDAVDADHKSNNTQA